MENNMTNELEQLSKRIGYQFQDIDLLDRSLRHRSVGKENNERLEFLGDAILGFIIAVELYQRHPQAPEGDLSRMRASLVNRDMLASFAGDLNIGPYMRLGSGELRSGGQDRPSILADALEAIIGAIYLDAGMEVCRDCVLKWYGERFSDLAELAPEKDPKSALQEWAQAHKLPLPVYQSKASGQAHAQIFHVTCKVNGLEYMAEGSSTSRRKAEQMAAEQFLEKIK